MELPAPHIVMVPATSASGDETIEFVLLTNEEQVLFDAFNLTGKFPKDWAPLESTDSYNQFIHILCFTSKYGMEDAAFALAKSSLKGLKELDLEGTCQLYTSLTTVLELDLPPKFKKTIETQIIARSLIGCERKIKD